MFRTLLRIMRLDEQKFRAHCWCCVWHDMRRTPVHYPESSAAYHTRIYSLSHVQTLGCLPFCRLYLGCINRSTAAHTNIMIFNFNIAQLDECTATAGQLCGVVSVCVCIASVGCMEVVFECKSVSDAAAPYSSIIRGESVVHTQLSGWKWMTVVLWRLVILFIAPIISGSPVIISIFA